MDLQLVLEHSRDLQRATTVQELLDVTRQTVAAVAGYQHAWLCVIEPGPPELVRLLAISGAVEDVLWERAPRFPVGDDAMLQEIRDGRRPVVVEDARTDPRTDKAMVEKLGNRTIVNVPMLLGDVTLGAIGMGTFGDEGVRPPSAAALDQLTVVAIQVAAAFQRVKLLEEHRLADREREQLRRQLGAVQRIESLALLSGGIAHDFNNMLTVIANNIRFAVDDPTNARAVREDLDAALEATQRASALTAQLLALGRQQNLRLQALDLNTQIRALVGMLRRVFPENVSLDIIPGASLPTVNADSTQLDQVLMNLCLNAREAMPKGGRLTIETEQVVINGDYVDTHPWARSGRYVLISVTDTGHGMPAEVQERVFEPFFTTRPGAGGTGLGLAVAAGVVAQHGGMINCYSEVGMGTTFKVYLPVHERSAAAVGSKIEAEVPRGHERILVAEDDPSVQKIARRILSRAGYAVDTVSDGHAAAEAALAQQYDLVLLDAVMPVATGREAYESIRRQRPRTAFLFASGHSRDVLPDQFLADSDVELVDKPYHPDDLLRAVRRALDRRPG